MDIEDIRKKYYDYKKTFITNQDIDDFIKNSFSLHIMSTQKGREETMPDAEWEEAYKKCGKKHNVEIEIKKEEIITREKALEICKNMGIPCY